VKSVAYPIRQVCPKTGLKWFQLKNLFWIDKDGKHLNPLITMDNFKNIIL